MDSDGEAVTITHFHQPITARWFTTPSTTSRNQLPSIQQHQLITTNQSPKKRGNLNRDLPGLHGDEVCREIVRRRLLTGVLMLTAAGTIRDRVEGLGLGADDYLSKPFAYEELVARVLALSRRARPAYPPVIDHAGITLDTARRQASRDGRFLTLSPKEFAVLEVLLRADGTVISTEDLVEQVWDEHTSYSSNTVRITLSKLRAKLGDPPLIETVSGSGYRI